MAVFSQIERIEIPDELTADMAGRGPAFDVVFVADGEIPFPQVIVWEGGRSHLYKGDDIQAEPGHRYRARIPAGQLSAGHYRVQVEGCKVVAIETAGGDDWVKAFAKLVIRRPVIEVGADPKGAKIYFGIHKHMHQPYYAAADSSAWDGEKDEIFGSRRGPYTSFIPTAVDQYVSGSLPHAGLSTSWSGTLIEQLDRCGREGLAGGGFGGWNEGLRAIAREQTRLGHPRVDFVAFHFFHALLPLIPHRDIVRGIQMHRTIIRDAFGQEASTVMFPPETAFHVRIIPALREAGVEVVIYDSIHRFRTCQDYPYAGASEGMLPPNPAEQVNSPVHDWMQLHNIWAGSKISPSLLRPEVVQYEDSEGEKHTIVGVPAERYIGNEDARGGFGALQYPSVLGQVYDSVVAHQTFDPKHPPFFILHSDGDNHGGGADSYYNHNTGRLVEWLRQDSRFELTTVLDYLERFPVDPSQTIHLEPGSWSGADNGDPQFRKWFSRYDQPYSPDLNSWAVLTALQNVVHAVEDLDPNASGLDEAVRLLLTAETSCYWYWTGQSVWDQQVTLAANRALDLLAVHLSSIERNDVTAPTIFPAWVTPENPGGLMWGPHGQQIRAPRVGNVNTLVFDIAGLRRVDLVVRSDAGERRQAMTDRGPYPSQTGAQRSARYFTAELPIGLGSVRYFIEAEDQRGHIGRSALERIHLA